MINLWKPSKKARLTMNICVLLETKYRIFLMNLKSFLALYVKGNI